jgi:hypothetical protein
MLVASLDSSHSDSMLIDERKIVARLVTTGSLQLQLLTPTLPLLLLATPVLLLLLLTPPTTTTTAATALLRSVQGNPLILGAVTSGWKPARARCTCPALTLLLLLLLLPQRC